MVLSAPVILKAVQRVLVFSAVVLGVSSGILWMHYYDTRPHTPDANVGRTIALNTHGISVYVNQSEDSRLQTLMVASAGCFLLAIVIEVIKTRGKFLTSNSDRTNVIGPVGKR